MLIYLAVNTVNSKQYFGKTIRLLATRWKAHVYGARRGSKLHFHNAIRKCGPEAFLVYPVCSCDSKEEMNVLETEFITLFKTHLPEYGYNLTLGGDGFNGKLSEKACRKISEAHRGKPLSEEHRQKIREALRGKPRSEEYCLKLSAATQGHPVSEKARRKIGEAHRGRKASEETRRKLSEAHRGKPLSEEHRQKLREAWQRRKAKENLP